MCSRSCLVIGITSDLGPSEPPFVERVCGVAHEESVFAIHDTQSADQDLVVQHDTGESFYVAHLRTFLEGVYIYARDADAVKSGGVVSEFSHDVPRFVGC